MKYEDVISCTQNVHRVKSIQLEWDRTGWVKITMRAEDGPDYELAAFGPDCSPPAILLKGFALSAEVARD